MIKYLQHGEINKKKWDDCINLSPLGLVYALSWYLDAVHPGWEALVENDYEGVFPLTSGKKFGINYLYQPFFNQKLGAFSRKPCEYININPYLEALGKRFRYVDIKLNRAIRITVKDFQVNMNINIELDLSDDLETLRSNYSENAIQNLRKFNGENIVLNEEKDSDLLIRMFRSNMGKTLPKIKDIHYSGLKKVMDTAFDKRTGRMFVAKNQKDRFLAGAFFITCYKRAVFLFSANTEEGREKRAMYGIIDSFIEENAGKKLILDFEGSNDKNLARFYKSFGGKVFYYPGLRINKLPRIIRWLKK
ncbi:MAG: hypothetical protein IMY71_15770 [Bacteroidetes bacterium]|nr:hypothetical protein [Bacteroidota bacterium]